MSLALAAFIKRPQADAQIGVEDNLRHSNIGVNLMLWLYQRHALKAFRAAVGEEGHRIKLFIDWEPESHIFLLANQNKI